MIQDFRQGHTAEEIVALYPVLQLADVYAVISYYLRHRQAVYAYLQEQEAAAEFVWRDIEKTAEISGFFAALVGFDVIGMDTLLQVGGKD